MYVYNETMALKINIQMKACKTDKHSIIMLASSLFFFITLDSCCKELLLIKQTTCEQDGSDVRMTDGNVVQAGSKPAASIEVNQVIYKEGGLCALR